MGSSKVQCPCFCFTFTKSTFISPPPFKIYGRIGGKGGFGPNYFSGSLFWGRATTTLPMLFPVSKLNTEIKIKSFVGMGRFGKYFWSSKSSRDSLVLTFKFIVTNAYICYEEKSASKSMDLSLSLLLWLTPCMSAVGGPLMQSCATPAYLLG